MFTCTMTVEILIAIYWPTTLTAENPSAHFSRRLQPSLQASHVTERPPSQEPRSTGGGRIAASSSDRNVSVAEGTRADAVLEPYRQVLDDKTRQLRAEIRTARQAVTEKHQRECHEVRRPDKDVTKRAREVLDAVRNGLTNLQNPRVSRVEILEGTTPVWVITRANAGLVLATAEADCRAASRPVPVPPDMRLRHQLELQQYDVIQNHAEQIKTECLEALGRILGDSHETRTFTTAMAEWQEEVERHIEKTSGELVEVRRGTWVPEHIEPVGFFYHHTARRSTAQVQQQETTHHRDAGTFRLLHFVQQRRSQAARNGWHLALSL